MVLVVVVGLAGVGVGVSGRTGAGKGGENRSDNKDPEKTSRWLRNCCCVGRRTHVAPVARSGLVRLAPSRSFLKPNKNVKIFFEAGNERS